MHTGFKGVWFSRALVKRFVEDWDATLTQATDAHWLFEPKAVHKTKGGRSFMVSEVETSTTRFKTVFRR